MDPSQIVLDKLEYDTLILGTGFLESCITAILSTQKHSCLVIDLDSSYSSGTKTCNLKEFPSFMKNLLNSQANSTSLTKNWNYMPIELKLPDGISEPSELKLSMYKNYNLDINPRFLQSSSPAVTLLQNADMDKYMDFSALQGIYIYLDKSFIKVPETKGEIFSSSSIGIMEKRSLWKCLGALIDAGRIYKQETIDVNSTEDWEKGVEGGEICKKFENDNCFKLFQHFANTDKVNQIILYVIAAYEYNANIKQLKTKELAERVYDYVKSLGIHSQFPYLYTNYGTGDLSQGFSRISAVNGGIFILNENIKVTKIEETDKTGKKAWKIYTPLAGDAQFLTCNSIVAGAEYKQSLSSIFTQTEQNEKENEKLNTFQITKKNYLLRGTIVFEKPESNQKDPHASPSIWIVPPELFEIQNHPITVMSFNSISNTVPKSKFCIQYQTIYDIGDAVLDEDQNTKVKGLAQEINEFLINQLGLSNYQIHFSCSYLQTQRDHNKINVSSIYYLPDDDFSLFFDNEIPVLNQFLSEYFPPNYLQENVFKKVDQEEEKKEKESDDDNDNDILSQLLGNLKELEIQEGANEKEEQKKSDNLMQQDEFQQLQSENLQENIEKVDQNLLEQNQNDINLLNQQSLDEQKKENDDAQNKQNQQ